MQDHFSTFFVLSTCRPGCHILISHLLAADGRRPIALLITDVLRSGRQSSAVTVVISIRRHSVELTVDVEAISPRHLQFLHDTADACRCGSRPSFNSRAIDVLIVSGRITHYQRDASLICVNGRTGRCAISHQRADGDTRIIANT